jgi:predicted ArsR family transcriptional regulator
MEAPTPLADLDLLQTLAFVRAEPKPPTAADVSAALTVPRSVARWRLERLVEAGLLVPGFARRNGRRGPGAGRPAKTYAVAPGSTPVGTSQRYSELVRLLIAALPARSRRPRLAEVGRRFGVQLAREASLEPARRADTAARRICRALGQLGFQTSAEASSTEITFVTPTCPLRSIVVRDQTAVDVDRGMWRGLVAAALSQEPNDGRCETHGCLATNAPCRIVVELSGHAKTATGRIP